MTLCFEINRCCMPLPLFFRLINALLVVIFLKAFSLYQNCSRYFFFPLNCSVNETYFALFVVGGFCDLSI